MSDDEVERLQFARQAVRDALFRAGITAEPGYGQPTVESVLEVFDDMGLLPTGAEGARALRDAADEFPDDVRAITSTAAIRQWLIERADKIERGSM